MTITLTGSLGTSVNPSQIYIMIEGRQKLWTTQNWQILPTYTIANFKLKAIKKRII
ncbi:MAG: hypothetical protein JWQ63_1309 [Mucilaginibacter sp.]|nr:hypothetical protein [Mucilaginibacter sp.]